MSPKPATLSVSRVRVPRDSGGFKGAAGGAARGSRPPPPIGVSIFAVAAY